MSKSKLNKIIENFVNEAIGAVVDEHISITNKHNEYSVDIDAYKICVPKKFNKKTAVDEQFEQFFRSLSNYAKDFSFVTLSILHEMGHIVTDDDIPLKYDRFAEIDRITAQAKSKNELIRSYFRLYDEKMATLWAVKWLTVKANRKLAKQFEDEFYASLMNK